MHCTRDDILKSARKRTGRSRLMTADRYYRAMEACFHGGTCPSHLFQAARPGEWTRSLKEAESRLVWTDRAAVVESAHLRQRDDGASLAPGAVMDFDAIVTTTRRDRDHDVMESAGADVDPRAVLLWQHVPLLPIGRLVQVTEQSESRVRARLAIADTELGRDAAALAAFGALKISHGFEPLEFEPLADGGWHFKKFEIYEISLVSVPSNRDAVITAFSRGKLHSPFMKEWASGIYRRRPVLGRGAKLAGRRSGASGSHAAPPAAPPACSCGRNAKQSEGASESCAAAGARFIARAARSTADDLPALIDVHAATGRLIDRFESERQSAEIRAMVDSLDS